MATTETYFFLFLIALMAIVGFITGLLTGLYWYIPKLGETDFNMKEIENNEKH
jgi:hypothetical protein